LRIASALFALLVAWIALSGAATWGAGSPNALQIGAVATYITLSVFLWRRSRPAAYIGVIIASLGLLLLIGATYFLWPIVSAELSDQRGILNTTATMFLPLTLNLAIAVVLVRELLSNNRWSGRER
jgi:vacuolar-type H+-ATPase subunit I/STV1